MHDELPIFRKAIGDPTFTAATPMAIDDACHLTAYSVELPRAKYHGFPPHWTFVTVSAPKARTALSEIQEVIQETEAFVLMHSERTADRPLLLLSNNQSLRLADNLATPPANVFLLDAVDLEGRKGELPPRQTPLFAAIRRRLTLKEVSAWFFSPYICNKPAEDWRFFGRHREVEALVKSNESFILVGGRRVGKTSLVTAAKERLEADHKSVYLVDVQDCTDEQGVLNRILDKIATRDLEAAKRRQQATGEPLLAKVLGRITAKKSATVLILDEFGNVAAKRPDAQWQILGIIRQAAQTGYLRVIMTGFQDILTKQRAQFSGPLVNFASVMRLRVFTPLDVDEFLVKPLEIWGNIESGATLTAYVLRHVGRHPFILQHYGKALFGHIIANPNGSVLTAARIMVEDTKAFTDWMTDPMDLLFFKIPAAQRYLFLGKCIEAFEEHGSTLDAELNDDWVEAALQRAGYRSTTDIRRNILEELELRGLTEPHLGNSSTQTVVAPTVFEYLRHTEGDLKRLCLKYADDIEGDAAKLGLRSVAHTSATTHE